MWTIEKWYRWTSLQGRNRDADIEGGPVAMKGLGGRDELGDWPLIHITMYRAGSCWDSSVQCGELSSGSVMTQMGGMWAGGKAQESGLISKHVTGSLYGTAETNKAS